ncbi:MAG: ATP-binding protein [Symplocastrum torsivum CPER-KK1]|uniref:ATP-binding protein n=1 Tax=Symplocastrum torsivum CPER-KK1 TaxID=450513 RepID=A0A951UBN5_9CYAN|nr:ATP-binding protein [Symplocastrum torsivum CPER-KK1]
MKTAEELEKITDRAKFELLVTSVLRKDNRDYAAIIHTGINAQGETIRSPLDGFCRVPESVPPRFIVVEHTTTDRDGLEKKWLYDHSTAKSTNVSESKDGDLLKAGREAQKVRKDFPDAKFTVILTTNQHLSKGVELLNKVYKKAAELGVDVDIWEQSRLVDFLDSTPEGHWLRKEHLHIEAQMLSESLLGRLCEQSLANYEKQFLTSPNSWVYREIESQIEKGTHTNTYTIQLLIGESGSGKSAAAYQILKKHLGSGGYGLWVSDEWLRECTSLETAIDRVLRDLYPSLLPDAGRVALRIIPEGSRLLLIVDDVNRANNPTRQVENLVNWSKPKQSEPSDLPSSFSPYFVICPVWSQILGSISRDLNETAWVNNVFISSMTSAEGMVAVQTTTSDAGMEITNTEAISLATSLGNDPILIGLFASLLSSTQPCELNSLTENVVERFIKTAIKQVSSSPGTLLEIEYRDALSSLATFMLKNRRLFPKWKEIRNWFRESPDELTALRELTRHEKLCRLTPEKKFIFRHDRIQQTLLVESMIEILTDTNLDLDILYEPFYAEIIGRAIARSPQSKVFLRELRNQLPLALVEATRCFGTPTTDYHQAIIEEVKEWANSSATTGSVPESVLDAICWSLRETNSSAVLEITKKFPAYRPVLLARLRNGCTVSGVRYCIYEKNRYYFVPSCKDSLREQILEQAKHHHKEKLLIELRQILKSYDATDELRDGALTLAGFLGFPELEDDIETCWQLATDKTFVLPAAIWAVIQCCSTEFKKLLDPLVTYWAGLSDEKDLYGIFCWTLVYGLNDEVINYFIAQCNVHKSLHWSIANIFLPIAIEHPDVLEWLLKTVADIQRVETDSDELSHWAHIFASLWVRIRSANSNRQKLSQTSMERLRILWQSLESEDFLKQKAFDLWIESADNNQLQDLKAVQSNSTFFYKALEKRIELGDQTVVKEILPLIAMHTCWLQFAHQVWCDEVMTAAESYLESFKDNIPTDFSGGWLDEHYTLSNLLTLIPLKDAEMLLEKYWAYLGYSPPFIQAALYIGTSRCINLATFSINRCLGHVSVFKGISVTFGCSIHKKKDYLTVQHLERLVPYLNYLDECELWLLEQICQQLGVPEWGQKYLATKLNESHRKEYYPSNDDLLQELDELAAKENGVWRVTNWLDKFEKRHVSKSRALTIVDCWLAFNPTVKGLQIAAACIQSVGTRKDLSILDQYTIEGSPNEIAKIKESTRFAVYRGALD